jgi:hypothetical protein
MSKLYGITIDSIDHLPQIVLALKSFQKRPTVRIVFDEGIHAKDYLVACQQISQVADIMGELLDSYYLHTYSLAQYTARAQEYLHDLGQYVSIWEIGNEINGDWLGAQAAEKALAAFRVMHAAGKATALTCYYNAGCEDNHGNMFDWLGKNISSELKNGVDYALISYYEDDCNHSVLTAAQWEIVYQKLGAMFPNAKLGHGECGTSLLSKKAAMMQRYYSMKLSHPRFVGGYFWWYTRQDCIPMTKTLWTTLNNLFV